MRVLWFTNTSSGYNNGRLLHHYHGAGWISSLEQVMVTRPDIELAVSFFHPTDSEKCKQGNTTYYPLLRKKGSYVRRLYNNWTSKMETEKDVKKFLDVVNDFKPDVIQIFGTEGPFGAIQGRTQIPIVIHIQGIINPYLNAWYPPGIDGLDVLLKGSPLLSTLKGNSIWFGRKHFIKRGKRESSYFPHTKYLMGRTSWDKEVSELLMPGATYFEVNEVLRSVFYDGKLWVPKERKKIKVISTISSSTYKGLDQVLKTSYVLKNFSEIDFEWIVCGIQPSDGLVKLMERKFKLKFADNNVTFLGATPADKLISLLLDSDLYVHPSYIETGCISIAEAQILGIPVIACYVGGLTTTIENNKTGILVPANDPYGMAAKIICLATEKGIASQIGMNAHKTACQRHNKEKIVSAILQVYNKIVNQ